MTPDARAVGAEGFSALIVFDNGRVESCGTGLFATRGEALEFAGQEVARVKERHACRRAALEARRAHDRRQRHESSAAGLYRYGRIC